MATDDSSNPARQSVLELVEILKRLGAHRRAMHEQTYGNPPWTRDQSDAYWYHPLVRACEWLEQRVGISRHDLEDAAFRLSTPQGLRGLDPLTGPGGRTTDAGQPDLLWMFSTFRELDRDGRAGRLSRDARRSVRRRHGRQPPADADAEPPQDRPWQRC